MEGVEWEVPPWFQSHFGYIHLNPDWLWQLERDAAQCGPNSDPVV